MSERTPWWLNLIALAAGVAPCVALGLPWFAAAIAALVTGLTADQVWRMVYRRRDRGN
ncbi:hypothetical protein [Streptomyces syringium]|uniref:hypothetical protein n=1 Tax=Streptomyces syringium TaxID=76729 RepID=UPI00341C11A4